jgi:hypothetical protein
VDLNPNSVKICRLRLWIELLKNAYYKTYKVSENLIGLNELETLPNIDINIKCGNSLISRFAIDADLKQALKKSKWNIDTYKNAVSTYRNSDNKEQKREIERLISDIKSDFRSEISKNDPKLLRKYKLEGEFYNLMNVNSVFGETEKEKKDKAKAAEKLNDEIQKLTKEIEDIKLNIIYENAFEWRFEFPEVLNDEGDFTGFDVVIGNPPYIQLQAVKEVSEVLKQFEYLTYERTGDIYSLFFEKGNQILKNEGFLAFITSNKWLRAGYGKATRNYFLKHTQPLLLVDLGSGVFDEATVDSSILLFKKTPFQNAFSAMDISKEREIKNIAAFSERFMNILPPADESWLIADGLQLSIKEKIERIGKPLKDWDLTINYGIKTGFNEAFIIDGKKKDELIAEDANSAKIIKPILRGRDIKRYKAEFADLWLINTHNGLKSKKLPPVDVEKQYPAIYKHLKQYEAQLIERLDKGEHWSNLRNCAYLQDFSKEKIVFQEMVQNSSFYYDGKGDYFCLDTGRIITGKSLKFLTAILNSKIFFYSVKKFYGGGGLGETGVRMKHTFFENFPLRDLNKTEQKPFVNLVNKILAKKEKNENTSDLEAQIDSLVYDLYELTEAEIKLVEKA